MIEDLFTILNSFYGKHTNDWFVKHVRCDTVKINKENTNTNLLIDTVEEAFSITGSGLDNVVWYIVDVKSPNPKNKSVIVDGREFYFYLNEEQSQ